jgi:hypothetical protein
MRCQKIEVLAVDETEIDYLAVPGSLELEKTR